MKILSESTLLDSIISGAVIPRARGGQAGFGVEVVELPTEEELEEDDVLLSDAQEDLLTVVLLKVIAAVWAMALPSSVAPPPVKEIDAWARTVPTMVVVPSKVAEESTFQKTLQAWAPPVRRTRLPVLVIKVDVK